MLQEHMGDNKLVAAALGISIRTLAKRLSLNKLIPAWKERMNDMPIGILDLVAPLPAEIQGMIGRFAHMTIEYVKKEIAALTYEIRTANFNTTECQTCKSNTASQNELFAEYEKHPRCLNSECFKAKNENMIEIRQKEFAVKHPDGYIEIGCNKNYTTLPVIAVYELLAAKKKGKQIQVLYLNGAVKQHTLLESARTIESKKAKTPRNLEASLHKRRINSARLIVSQKVNNIKTSDDAGTLAMRFGSLVRKDFCQPSDWTKKLDENDMFRDAKEVILRRLHHSGTASTLPADMEEELKNCCEWFEINWHDIWQKAVEENPVPKSWKK